MCTEMAGSRLCYLLLVVFAALSFALPSLPPCITAATGSGDLTAGFTRVRLRESQFVVQKPWNVPLDQRYEFAGGVRRMWVFDTDKPGGARTEIKINVIYSSAVWQFEGDMYVPSGLCGRTNSLKN